METLIDRYFAAVDDKRLDAETVAATFAPDGLIRRPDGFELVGHDVILAEQNQSFARFRATHHMFTNCLVDQDDDTARLRTNMQAVHIWDPERNDPLELDTHFVGGGVLTAVAVRTPDGWRLREMGMRLVWRTGSVLPMLKGLRH
ncbi:nuclear transport factor 2 family protein [Cryptosporangium arvum]|uniref:nuclear transport factor 2 family protein n=1 Tax=Cryptosporangium arvum TaxID=80871 RepID=UPI0004AECCCE|nr:nuclear transport factor 2 family protein [Cryptosporangium arvum]